MSALPLEQQLLLAHRAVKRNWVLPDDLRRALRCWEEGSLPEYLLARRLLTVEQVQTLLADEVQGDTVEFGSDTSRHSSQSGQSNQSSGNIPCRYVKMRPHARGGLGEVFVARDEELQREVALKEIRDHVADQAEARSRFLREAEVTGNLEHPGIVPVYGLGAYPDGRPYYAMRFIRGQSLKTAIQHFHQETQAPSALRPLLARFVAVCNAVAFAHSRGVIHRDIKPDNIMLGDYGETLVVDWGLARVEAQDEESTLPAGRFQSWHEGDSLPTQEGQALGSPGYMPPEQARGDLKCVGRASDVFSLGATLYAILTGRAPYKGTEAVDLAVACQWQPVRQVNDAIPLALGAICAKAMAKEPAHRYATARELAQDVERWLADEPVSAHREPGWDRVRRWGRRNRTVVTSGVVLLLVSVVGLIVGLAAVSAEQVKTAKERDRARENERRALKAEQEARDNLKTAQENLKLAKKAVNETFDLAKSHPLLKQDSMREIRKLLLEKALPFYRKFRTLRGNDREGQWELGDQLFHVGYITSEIGDKIEARKTFEQASAVFEALDKKYPGTSKYPAAMASTLDNVGLLLWQQGHRAEARKTYLRAIAIQRQLAVVHPKEASHRHELARTLSNMGILLGEEGERDKAISVFREARDLRRKLTEADPKVIEYRNDLATTLANLGIMLKEAGQRAEAMKVFIESQNLHEKLLKDKVATNEIRASLARTIISIGNMQREDGKRKEARASYLLAVRLFETLVKDNPLVGTYRTDLASSLNNLGLLLSEEGQHAEARARYIRAKGLYEKLLEQNPGVVVNRQELAQTLTNIAVLLKDEGKLDEALKTFVKAKELREKLTRENPRSLEIKTELAITLTNMGNLLAEQGKPGEALKLHERAKTIQENLVKTHPKNASIHSDLATTLNNIGTLFRDQGKLSQARKLYQQAHDIQVKITRAHPKVAQYRIDLAVSLNNLGIVLVDEGHFAAAHPLYKQAQAILEKLVEENPRVILYQKSLGGTLNNLGVVLRNQDKPAEAVTAYAKARDIREKLAAAHPTVPGYRSDLAVVLYNLGNALAQATKRDEAMKVFTRSGDLFAKLLKTNPDDQTSRFGLVRVYLGQSIQQRGMKKPKEALATLDLGFQHLDVVVKADPRSPIIADLMWRLVYNRARALGEVNRHAEAAREWQRFIRVAPAEHRNLGQFQLAISLIFAGNWSEAMTLADVLGRLSKRTASQSYDLACIGSICAGGIARDPARPLPWREQTSETYARKALGWLLESHKAGFFKSKANRDHLAKDPDLNFLRNRADFKQFVGKLNQIP